MTNNNQYEVAPSGTDRWMTEWEIAPRDGPAVFIVDTATLDQTGTRRGRWLDPTRDPDTVRADIEDCLGIETTESGQWAVIEQIGLGKTMIPEQLSIDALVRHCRHLQERPR